MIGRLLDTPGLPGPALVGAAQRATLAALNHVLTQQVWAREQLRSYAGAGLAIAIDPSVAGLRRAPPLYARVRDDGTLGLDDRPRDDADASSSSESTGYPGMPAGSAAGAGAAPPSVTLWIRPSLDAAFAWLRSGAAKSSVKGIRIEGDAGLASVLGRFAHDLRWDWADDLSRVTGDVAARRVELLVDRVRRDSRGLRERFESVVADFVTGEAPHLVSQTALHDRRAVLADLAQRVDSLEQRVARVRRH